MQFLILNRMVDIRYAIFNESVTSYKSFLVVGYFLKGIKGADVNDSLKRQAEKREKRKQ